tara:strand:- start:406 stop:1014 length:609 start_codon:yes stop_codon:yes gene_type:complete
MTTLQHNALYSLVKSGVKYDGNNVVIENVIFEIDQLRQTLMTKIDDYNEEYKLLQKVKNKKACPPMSIKCLSLIDEISKELFDDFTYSEASTSYEVEWKEYFHCVYDYAIPAEGQPYNKRVWETLPEPPPVLDVNSPRWALVNSIKNNFEKLRIEGEKSQSLSEILKEQSYIGKELICLKNEIIQLNKTLDVYNTIILWSMN